MVEQELQRFAQLRIARNDLGDQPAVSAFSIGQHAVKQVDPVRKTHIRSRKLRGREGLWSAWKAAQKPGRSD